LQGRVISFANTILIMTSNVGSAALLEGGPGARGAVLAAARAHFRPEFLNRLDEQIVFDPLTRPQLREVARLQAAELGGRLAEHFITLELDDAALDFAVASAFDPVYGARPLRR
jgi:ATP-dependent Clp protease ATP-binding subunit ClpB